jgi:flavin reductase (DIM6/NTAB) family NADH-FMN oxidoreductase RutF
MLHFEPKDLPVPKVHQYMLGGIQPRPIALVSTISEDGAVNLSPFSFFNAFGANPPMIAFSPARRGRDGSVKDTYNNLNATRECVVQAVTHAMVQQVSLASAEYPPDVDEFVKAGLTPIKSDIVRPPRVKESPYQMECRLRQMIDLGGRPGSGNLALCEVVKFHIAEDIIRDGVIHPDLIDLVGRQGANFYCRASGESVFEVAKPVAKTGIGFDNLPEHILRSHVLSANNLAQLANVEVMPDSGQAERAVAALTAEDPTEELFYRYERLADYENMLRTAVALYGSGHPRAATFIELAAREALEQDDVPFAWNALLYLGKQLST